MTSKTDHKVKKSGRTKWTQSFLIFRPRLPQNFSYYISVSCFAAEETNFRCFHRHPLQGRRPSAGFTVQYRFLKKISRALPQKLEMGKDPRNSSKKEKIVVFVGPGHGPDLSKFFSCLLFFTYTNQTLKNFLHFLALFHKNTFLLKKIFVLSSSCPYVFWRKNFLCSVYRNGPSLDIC